MPRYARLSNVFSCKVENHAAAVALNYFVYNFIQIRRTLRMTPAMAAGVTDHLWSVDGLLESWGSDERSAGRAAYFATTTAPVRLTEVYMEGLLQPTHLFFLFLILLMIAFYLIPFWQICKKAGFSPWLSLLILVPLLNVLALYYIAFARWPNVPGSK